MKVYFSCRLHNSGIFYDSDFFKHLCLKKKISFTNIDYTYIYHPENRVESLINYIKNDNYKNDPIILIGAGMGGYVSIIASKKIKPIGLLLLAPSIGNVGGFKDNNPIPIMRNNISNTFILQGSRDDIISPKTTKNYSHQISANLRLIDSDHRLNNYYELEKIFNEVYHRSLKILQKEKFQPPK